MLIEKYQRAVVDLHFTDPGEFARVFKKHNEKVTDTIVNEIEQAVIKNKRTAKLFNVSFDDSDVAFEISLGSHQWVQALESCLDHYHELQRHDDCIDTWKLIEAIKVIQ